MKRTRDKTKIKRPRFPVALHLNQAVGALTLHTGVGAVLYTTEPAAISCVAKQTISMRRAQKNEQERQPIFVYYLITTIDLSLSIFSTLLFLAYPSLPQTASIF